MIWERRGIVKSRQDDVIHVVGDENHARMVDVDDSDGLHVYQEAP